MSAPETSPETANPIDLLWGAGAIAAAIGRTTRATYHLLESGALPAKRIGGRWCVSRKKLLDHFEELAS